MPLLVFRLCWCFFTNKLCVSNTLISIKKINYRRNNALLMPVLLEIIPTRAKTVTARVTATLILIRIYLYEQEIFKSAYEFQIISFLTSIPFMFNCSFNCSQVVSLNVDALYEVDLKSLVMTLIALGLFPAVSKTISLMSFKA